MAQHFPKLLEATFVVVNSQVPEDLDVLVLSLGVGLVGLQPLAEGSDVALLKTRLTLPQLPVLVQQVDLLLDRCDFPPKER